jgi:AcrR family transcriptional regulator
MSRILPADDLEQSRRAAILSAAAQVFAERGYDAATTLEIAARAKTSKRAIYASFGNKRGIVRAMIAQRVREMQRPLELEPPATRDEFFAALQHFGITFMAELLAPTTIGLIRLAIAEAARSTELGTALDDAGRLAVMEALTGMFAHAAAQRWVRFADVQRVADIYMFTLMGDVLMRLMIGAGDAPGGSDLRKRAELAVDVVREFDRAAQMRGPDALAPVT